MSARRRRRDRAPLDGRRCRTSTRVYGQKCCSPGDETYEKLDWYARLSVAEILVVDPDSRAVELFASRAGRAVLVQPGADGTLRLASLGADMRTTDGPRLRITWETGSAEI